MTDAVARALPWPDAAATALGSMPGTDVLAAARAVRDTLAVDGAVPHLAEVPARGPGADMVGRALGRLAQVWPAWAAETGPTGWRLVDAPGRDVHRAQSYLGQDLDVLEEVYDGWSGPLTLPLAGPWTLAASVELAGGERLVRDPGAVRDLVASWTEAARELCASVARRLPGARVVLQADEPALPAVLAGAIPTASGRHRYRAVDVATVRESWQAAVTGLDAPVVVHCCAAEVPFSLLRESGVAGIAYDPTLLSRDSDEALGECIDAGVRLVVGGVGPGHARDVAAAIAPVHALGARLGFDTGTLVRAVAVSPPCGLAGATPAEAGERLRRTVAAARALRDEQGDAVGGAR